MRTRHRPDAETPPAGKMAIKGPKGRAILKPGPRPGSRRGDGPERGVGVGHGAYAPSLGGLGGGLPPPPRSFARSARPQSRGSLARANRGRCQERGSRGSRVARRPMSHVCGAAFANRRVGWKCHPCLCLRGRDISPVYQDLTLPTSRPGRYEGPALGLYNISKVLPWVPLPQKVTARRLPGPFRSARWW